MKRGLAKYSLAAQALEDAFKRSFSGDGKRKLSKTEVESALGKFNQSAREVRREFRLGIIGRAVTAYQFQRRLLDNGHTPEIVRQILFSMVINAFVG